MAKQSKRPAGRIPPERAATPEEVRAAILALTEEDHLCLGREAKSLMGVANVRGRGPDDLLQEAIAKMLNDERRWNPRVPFRQFLHFEMKSIVNHWFNEAWTTRVTPESVLMTETAEGEGRSPLLDASTGQTHEAAVAAKQQIEAIIRAFERDGDDEAALLFDALRYHTPAEIQDALRWTQTLYETIRCRMVRKILKWFPKE